MTITKETPKETLISLAPACKCKQCESGCHYGSGILDDNDLKPMADFLHISVEELKEKYLEPVEKFHTTKYRPKIKKKWKRPYGTCIFFSRWKGCKVHQVKPLECKIATGCKPHGEDAIIWLNLNQFVNSNDPESIRQYASYLSNGGKTIPGGELETIVPDKNRLNSILDNKINNKPVCIAIVE